MVRLSEAALAGLPAAVAVPRYDRSKVNAGIVHFGVGGFHRAHQAMYLDRLLNAGEASDWGICGVGVLEVDRRMKQALEEQDHLYTLVLKHPDGTLEPRVIGSIVDYLLAPDDPQAVVEKLADPGIRIVSLTITEGGYNFDQITREFDASNPAVQADLVPGALPQTVFGLVVAGLALRRSRGIEPFTVMSCDNIPGNGELARKVFAAFARLKDPELADWLEASVRFPNSMVDRITPVTTDADRVLVQREWGIDDGWPVVAEPFEQWVLEDSFGLGRPAYETVGVQVVDEVEPYELMKLRLLNVGHQAIAYFGVLAGYTFAHEAARDPLFVGLLRRYWDREARPTLRPVPGVDLDAYTAELVERFGNEHVRDTLARLAAESSDRIPKWLVPVIRARLDAGGEVDASAALVASWARYAEGVDESGNPITIVDRLADSRHTAALAQASDPLAFLRDESLFGSLAAEPAFTVPYLRTLDALHARGARAALTELVGEPAAS
ncbi:mannitol dehydrogenase family protein [Gryllotalpicola protaetiae]|uniref:Mannitol-1-phosphate 5-dehydrogenase n=1 Tax=Gryllotalpicola protaetiae TaxID=2419771 RepID=A0A387BQN4_9MICO|nr:mannitol dehydrogenase family protein [Gryllotalpicola protaetiae]AYG03340.1 mannitol dehydrogenase family protein [Gryllotalpicola protaetiae]